jgi:glycosyltransferase involved in cell wall biosynthesis
VHKVWYLQQERNLGFVANVNIAFACSEPADPVVLNSDCVVSQGWLDGLRDAAYSDTRVATASTLTNHGTILSVPYRNTPVPQLPPDWNPKQAAAAIQARALRLHPSIPTAVGHCFYVRRSALELVGPLDEAFSPGYGEEVDFSLRCLLHGLSHVVADDVFVFHHAGASFTEEARAIQHEHEKLIHSRYPYYPRFVEATRAPANLRLDRALSIADQAIRGLSVTIDARVLGPQLMGTQVVVLETIHALARTQRVRLRVLAPPDLGEYARIVLDELPGVERINMHHDPEHVERTDVVHRPSQVSFPEDLDLLLRYGKRLVITHLDLIGYNNPGYFPDFDHWERYRRVTRRALAMADRVSFISRTAAEEALADELLDDPSRLAVIYPGTDHRLAQLRPDPKSPVRAGARLPNPYLLCLGTDYKHKNRLFALRVLAELKNRHGWPGGLVFAGPHVLSGSSGADEAAFLASNPELAGAVATLPGVTEAEKAWLLGHAAAVIYPTLYEGFGLVPFEAAAAGTPCLFAAESSLAETLPRDLARIVPWDAGATAELVLDTLDGDGRDKLVAGIANSAALYTWEKAAESTVELYEQAATGPAREAAALAEDSARLEGLAAEHEHRATECESFYATLLESIGDDGLALVGPEAVLPANLRRPILAVTTRRWLRGPLFGPLRLGYGSAYWLLHRGRRQQLPS